MLDLDQLARDSIRRNALTTAAGVAGVDSLGLLAASSLAPLIEPRAANYPDAATITSWLGGFGGDALASWLSAWRHKSRASVTWHQESERTAVVALAQELSAKIASDQAAADTIAAILLRLDALSVVLDELRRSNVDQLSLLKTLLEDVQRFSRRNWRLQNTILEAVRSAAEHMSAERATHDARVPDTIQSVLDEVRRLQALPVAPTIIVGGHVGTMQSITVAHGTISTIIGTQQNIASAEPADRDTASRSDPRLPALRHILVNYFSEDELRTLCFELGIDYSDLPGRGRAGQARELVAFAARHATIDALIEACRRERHEIDWETLR